jgi:chaperonin GroES
MKVVPLGQNLVVKRLEPQEATAGGIVLPAVHQERAQQGRVLSIGDGKMLPDGSRAAHEVGEGDRVLFHGDSGNEVVVDGQALLIMSEDDILAIVR